MVRVEFHPSDPSVVYHVDQLKAGFVSRTDRKCDTYKALEFSTLWFGTSHALNLNIGRFAHTECDRSVYPDIVYCTEMFER